MDCNFLQWSIPNFFIQNYLTQNYHQCCKKNNLNYEKQCLKQGNFIHHYQQYLHKWCRNRGKWIKQFEIQQQKLIIQNKNKQQLEIVQKKVYNFYQLLSSLNLKEEQIYFVGFLTRFYKLISIQINQYQRQQIIQQLVKIYFQYRLQLSFQSSHNLEQPPQIINFIKFIVINQNTQNLQYSIIQNSLFQKIAQQCEFDYLLRQVQQYYSNKSSINNQKFEQFTPIKNKVKQTYQNKQAISKNITTPSQMTPQNIYKKQGQQYNRQKNRQIPTLNKQGQKLSEEKQKMTKSIISQIEKQKQKSMEAARKIIKTTRFSNFKGTFLKKPAVQIYNYQQINKTQNPIFYDIQYNKMNVIKKKKAQKQQIDLDFLCDKSI